MWRLMLGDRGAECLHGVQVRRNRGSLTSGNNPEWADRLATGEAGPAGSTGVLPTGTPLAHGKVAAATRLPALKHQPSKPLVLLGASDKDETAGGGNLRSGARRLGRAAGTGDRAGSDENGDGGSAASEQQQVRPRVSVRKRSVPLELPGIVPDHGEDEIPPLRIVDADMDEANPRKRKYRRSRGDSIFTESKSKRRTNSRSSFMSQVTAKIFDIAYVFDEAQAEVYALMSRDSFQRFIRTSAYCELLDIVEAEKRGKDLAQRVSAFTSTRVTPRLQVLVVSSNEDFSLRPVAPIAPMSAGSGDVSSSGAVAHNPGSSTQDGSVSLSTKSHPSWQLGRALQDTIMTRAETVSSTTSAQEGAAPAPGRRTSGGDSESIAKTRPLRHSVLMKHDAVRAVAGALTGFDDDRSSATGSPRACPLTTARTHLIDSRTASPPLVPRPPAGDSSSQTSTPRVLRLPQQHTST